ncbi:6321_t:CDS:2, partial [Paraglomus occultum]
TANDKTVLKKIWNSISDGVTREMLQRNCENIRCKWKERDRLLKQTPKLSISHSTVNTSYGTMSSTGSRPQDIVQPPTPSIAQSTQSPFLISPPALGSHSRESTYFDRAP